MLSTALLEKEFIAIQKFSAWGIEVDLISPNNIFEWIAKIKGLPKSIWKESLEFQTKCLAVLSNPTSIVNPHLRVRSGVFSVFLKFSPKQTTMEPDISFCTIPFHPNVDPAKGNIQLEFGLIEQKGLYILNILLYIQELLSNPVLENAINPSAKEMLLNLPHAYEQIVADCVLNSQKIEDGHFHKLEVTSANTENSLDKPKQKINNKSYYTSAKISFEKYHFDWSNIATCKVKYKK